MPAHRHLAFGVLLVCAFVSLAVSVACGAAAARRDSWRWTLIGVAFGIVSVAGMTIGFVNY